MQELLITGGRRLSGEITISGAKNAVLPILAASLISGGVTIIENAPRLSDVESSLEILRMLGCEARWSQGNLYIDSKNAARCRIPAPLTGKMRSSVIFLGALLARFGSAVISAPGGCELGARPVDIHLRAMRALGASVYELAGDIYAACEAPRGGFISLPFPSVGATENAMILAASAKGVTVIKNAAREPEIRDLADYLRALGAGVYGAGTSNITVSGREDFNKEVVHRVIPDRIEAATYMACVCAAGGSAAFKGIREDDMRSVLEVFRAMGAEIKTSGDELAIAVNGRLSSPGSIITAPFPGFPTDAQPPVCAALSTCGGTTEIAETIFENRFSYAPELRKMGGSIKVTGTLAVINGVERLHGERVCARDLRGGAALMAAALGAEGESRISGLEHIKRGYADPEGALKALGAEVLLIQ
ncbi:MAG: UDP-N-acetylglucosamine 1-carboxyvinyltransferase [Oscillospiraceae bacterium]|nr:UDP-N-acetylglucosamine 1-carboxyvinyltransferase [Oscillospiraceae bacterium]